MISRRVIFQKFTNPLNYEQLYDSILTDLNKMTNHALTQFVKTEWIRKIKY